MLKVQEVNQKKEWNDFLLQQKVGFYPFFQSWEWGEVERKAGFHILRLGLYKTAEESFSETLVGVCLLIDVKARRGRFIHARHGPVLTNASYDDFSALFEEIKLIAKKSDASFIRISPLWEKSFLNNSFFSRRWLAAPIHNMDAEICWVLDITKPQEELLKEMRKTHRYLIKKAQTMDIKIIRTRNVSDISTFLSIYDNLSKRKHFVPHRGIQEEFETFSKEDNACLFLAEYHNKIIAGSLIVFVGDMAIYRHGASLAEYKDIPASYLLQWEAILEAKKRNKKIYNFWGIAPSDKENHPWKGLTLFKTGFGGTRKEFMHAQDFPLDARYLKNYIIEYARKLLRGY